MIAIFRLHFQEVGIHIGNILKVHAQGFVKANYRTPFNEQKIVKYLTDMVPGLRISRDFRLATKPTYLNRLICRHTPIPSSSINGGQNGRSTLKLSNWNPTVVIERCDALLTRQQKIVLSNCSNDDDAAETVSLANPEPCFVECAQIEIADECETDVVLQSGSSVASNPRPSSCTAEESVTNVQNNIVLLTVPDTSNPFNKNSTAIDANDVAINRNGTEVSGSENAPFNGMRPVGLQIGHPQNNEHVEDSAQTSNTADHLSNEMTENTELMEIDDPSRNDNVLNLPLATTSANVPENCDWEMALDKYQRTIEKRQRIIGKMILKRERALHMKISQLNSTVKILKTKNHRLQISVHSAKSQRNEQLRAMVQNAVEQTKRKKWCWICQTELRHAICKIALCKNCMIQWYLLCYYYSIFLFTIL